MPDARFGLVQGDADLAKRKQPIELTNLDPPTNLVPVAQTGQFKTWDGTTDISSTVIAIEGEPPKLVFKPSNVLQEGEDEKQIRIEHTVISGVCGAQTNSIALKITRAYPEA